MNIGEVISYWDMCNNEGASLQKGMNYRLHGKRSVILMSLRPNAPYADRIEGEGRILIYEGHDVPKNQNSTPKSVNQEANGQNGRITQNGLFLGAAERFKSGGSVEKVNVYEKIRSSIWTYNGVFDLIDAWQEESHGRKVFKFKLELIDGYNKSENENLEKESNRIIPANIKLEVWKRDKGCCVICGTNKDLHFDHIIPFSKGGSSSNAKNIQLLCSKHNLAKHDKIE